MLCTIDFGAAQWQNSQLPKQLVCDLLGFFNMYVCIYIYTNTDVEGAVQLKLNINPNEAEVSHVSDRTDPVGH